jgi:hypothetical protein
MIWQGLWHHRHGGETRGAHVDGRGRWKVTGKVRVVENMGAMLVQDNDEVA